MTPKAKTEIVIATLAEPARAELLLRAIDSALRQGSGVIVVINGGRFDASLRQRVADIANVKLIYVAQPGFPNAVAVGRRAVSARYFGFLDDDDYLLPGSIALREGYLEKHPEVDVVVTNGIRAELIGNQQLYESPAEVERIRADPLGAMLQKNWMTPCGPLYRTATVPASTFDNLARFAEWTDIGFRLIGERELRFLYDLTFYQSDTVGSLSKSVRQTPHTLSLHYRIAGKLRSSEHRALWNRRICSFHHQIAEDALADGQRWVAIQHHAHSLLKSWRNGALSFAPYTGRLIVALFGG